MKQTIIASSSCSAPSANSIACGDIDQCVSLLNVDFLSPTTFAKRWVTVIIQEVMNVKLTITIAHVVASVPAGRRSSMILLTEQVVSLLPHTHGEISASNSVHANTYLGNCPRRRWTDLIGERTRRCPHRQSQFAADPASQPGTPKQHRTPLNLHTSSSSRLNMAKRKDFCLERRHHTCTMYCRAAPCLTVVLRKKTLLLRLKRRGPRDRWFECHFGN
jgi:hypothetical protein